jgi:polyhydroxyalkanoate synthase
VHLIGYCIGGTITAAFLAWSRARRGSKEESPIAHSTLLATLVDFSDPGEIGVFVDENSIRWLDDHMSQVGYLDGKSMAASFRMLRSNSLLWHYVVHNYLLGETPPPFDVLYWNMDTTRLPAAMHSFYLREFYLHNRLVERNGVTLGDRPLDLQRIDVPLYLVGTEQDHITPWKGTFKLCGLAKGPIRYVLATSGHIMGIISPPVDPPKRHFRVGDIDGECDPEAWREKTEKVSGSWWLDWVDWLRPQCGELLPPRALGNGAYRPLAEAPGTYVLER